MSDPASENISSVIQNLAKAILKRACKKDRVPYEGMTLSLIAKYRDKLSKHLTQDQINGLEITGPRRVLESYGGDGKRTFISSSQGTDRVYAHLRSHREPDSSPRRLGDSINSLDDQEIDDRIEHIRDQLQSLGSDHDFPHPNYRHVKPLHLSDEEEDRAVTWNFFEDCHDCHSPGRIGNKYSDECPVCRSSEPCNCSRCAEGSPPHQRDCRLKRCGDFVIDEDLQEFKRKVIRKAEVIIGCYKKQLEECKKSRKCLEESLKCCQEKNKKLECKLRECHHRLEKCQEEKVRIIRQAKKCSEELHRLIRRYEKLQEEYRHKEEELRKCRSHNSQLEREVSDLRARLRECCQERKRLKEEVDQLICALEKCKNEKRHLRHQIQTLEEKLRVCEERIAKQQKLIRELQEEIERLKRKVKILICQNEELSRENADLRKQLGRTLTTLKCLCDKYDALKKKCQHHCK